MKAFILISSLLSFSAYATDFTAKIEDVSCKVSNGSVVRTQKIGSASFTEKKTVSISNLEAIVKKAVEVSSQIPAGPESELTFTMNHEGKTYTLNFEDSKESQILMRLISRICR